MAGLLEMLGVSSGDPAKDNALNQGLLSFGLNLMSSKRGNLAGALGEAGLAGLGTANQGLLQARSQGIQDKQLAFEEAQRARTLAQQKQQDEDQARNRMFVDQLPSPQMQAAQQGLMGGGGPSPENAARMPAVDPMAQLLHGAVKAGALPLSTYLQSLQKDTTPIKLGAGETLLAPGTFRPLASNPKEDSAPSAIKEYQFAKSQGYPGTFEQWDTSRKKAGASNVSMSVGAEKAFSKDLGTAAAKTFVDSQDAAQAAQGSLANVASVRDAMKQGSVILGPGAQGRQTGLRIGQVLGVGGKGAADTLARTKQVEQGLASLELDAAQLMKGQGVISESERLILRKVSGGQIQDLTPGELDTALNAIERNASRRINIHQQRVKQVPQGAVGDLAPFLQTPDSGGVRKFNPATGRIE